MLQKDADLTLDKAVRTAREDEMIRKQQALLRSDFQGDSSEVRTKTDGTLEYLSGRKPFNPRAKPGRTPQGQQKPGKCPRCGKTPAHERQQCPASEEKCHKCGKKGHWAKLCRTREEVRTVETDRDDGAFMGTVEQSNSSNPWSITLQVNGKPVEFKINTGADVTVIPMNVHRTYSQTRKEGSQWR